MESDFCNNAPRISQRVSKKRRMRRFKSIEHTQRFLSVHDPIQNLFRVGRHHLKAHHHRLLRTRAFSDWKEMTCAC